MSEEALSSAKEFAENLKLLLELIEQGQAAIRVIVLVLQLCKPICCPPNATTCTVLRTGAQAAPPVYWR